MLRLSAVVCALLAQGARAHGTVEALREQLQQVADSQDSQWPGSAISIAVYAGSDQLSASVAAGNRSRGASAKPATPDDLFPFGSCTKMFTATGILQLVERGTFSLNDTIPQHVDPVLSKESNGTVKLADIFGSTIEQVTVQMLLTMFSGLNDWDTDATRAWQNAHPTTDMTPLMLLQKTYANESSATPRFYCAPGSCGWYSSTNYVLLGYILARYSPGAENSWAGYDQRTVLPSSFTSTSFPLRHTYAQNQAKIGGVIPHGYEPDNTDVYNHSAAAGWTSGNVISTTAEMARWVHTLYSGPNVVSAASLAKMTDFNELIPWAPGMTVDYGMGTFLLRYKIDEGISVGHAGAVYGFYGYVAYCAKLNMTVAVATNEETKTFQENIYGTFNAAFDAGKKWVKSQ